MAETITFHFEGALAKTHKMNFYESARFQYAAARLIVKLAQFRRGGRFGEKISSKSNVDIHLLSQESGSFNINIEDIHSSSADADFLTVSLSDLVAYVSERIVAKMDGGVIDALVGNDDGSSTREVYGSGSAEALDQLAVNVMRGQALTADLPVQVQELVRRRVAELCREQRLAAKEGEISRIDSARSQKLVAMSAPLIREMATAFRRSADTLEITSSSTSEIRPVLFLDRKMAGEIETAIVDKQTTPILGDISQFNKDNGWGKQKSKRAQRVWASASRTMSCRVLSKH